MTALERIARALAAQHWRDTGASEEDVLAFADIDWREFVPDARAALTALREPDEAMIQAAAATPTEEEAELARVIAPGYFDGRPEGGIVRADAIEAARAILAAGYVKRNDALEEAAKACDALIHEADAIRPDEPSNYDFWQGAAIGAEESAARIRALKAKG